MIGFYRLSSLILAVGMSVVLARAEGSDGAASQILVERPWSRETPRSAVTGAGYMTIKNHGNSDDRLISARSDFAQRAELHRTTMENDVMRMRAATDGIIVPARGQIELQPGSNLHIMLVGLNEPLKEGARVPLTLMFERAGAVAVELVVESLRKRADPQQNHNGHGN